MRKNIKKYIIAGLLFTLPLIFPGQASFQLKPFVVAQWSVIIISLSLFALTMKLPLSVRLFYLWCAVTTFTSRLPQFSTLAFVFVTLILLLYKLLLDSKKCELHFCNKAVVYIICVQVLWILAQVMNRDFVMNLPRDINMVFGTMGNKNLLGALFLFSVVPCYLYNKWAIILPILGIVYSQASASIFSLSIGLIFVLIFINFKKHPKQIFSQHFTKTLIMLCITMSSMLAWNYIDSPVKGFMSGRWPIWNKVMVVMFEERTSDTVVINKFASTKKVLTDMVANLTKEKEKLNWFSGKKDLYTQKIDKAKKSLIKINEVEQKGKEDAASTFDVELIEKIRNPWLGYGLGTFKYWFYKKLTIKEAGGMAVDSRGEAIRDRSGNRLPLPWRQAHNTFLQYGSESGLIGMFFLLCIPGMMFAKFLRRKKNPNLVWSMAGVVMICCNALGNFPDRNIALMFFMMFGFSLFYKEVQCVK